MMERIHTRFDDGARGMLIQMPASWQVWLRRPDGALYGVEIFADPWRLEQAQEMAKLALRDTQSMLAQIAEGADPKTVGCREDAVLLNRTDWPGGTLVRAQCWPDWKPPEAGR